jgi:hypothetical protein
LTPKPTLPGHHCKLRRPNFSYVAVDLKSTFDPLQSSLSNGALRVSSLLFFIRRIGPSKPAPTSAKKKNRMAAAAMMKGIAFKSCRSLAASATAGDNGTEIERLQVARSIDNRYHRNRRLPARWNIHASVIVENIKGGKHDARNTFKVHDLGRPGCASDRTLLRLRASLQPVARGRIYESMPADGQWRRCPD